MSFLRDLKIAVRSLARVPALWITVALTLALGIGANAAIFSVVRAVLLRPLANRDEDRLLYVRQSAPGIGVRNATFSVPEIQDIGSGLKTIKELGTFSEIDFTVVGLGTPREIPAGVVDGNYFDVMGLRPVLGRLLGPADDGPNAAGAVVLTYHFWSVAALRSQRDWERRCGSRAYRARAPRLIVGVLEPSVPYPVATEIIANVVTSPHHLSATMVTGREHRMTEVFARLAPGATLDAARAELRSGVRRHGGGASRGVQARGPFHDRRNAHARPDQFARQHDPLDAVRSSGLLFVIASSNVANLVLARTVRRESGAGRTLGPGSQHRGSSPLRCWPRAWCSAEAEPLPPSLIAIPMVAVLGRYASRFSVRANDLTLDFSLVWFGIALALIAAVFLAFIPRLPSPDSPQGGLTGRGTRVAGGSSRRAAHLRRHADHGVVPAACRSVRADEDALRAGADAAAV